MATAVNVYSSEILVCRVDNLATLQIVFKKGEKEQLTLRFIVCSNKSLHKTAVVWKHLWDLYSRLLFNDYWKIPTRKLKSSLVIYSRTLTLRVTRLSICERPMAPPFAVEVKLNKFSEYWFETLQLINENVFCGVFGTKQSLISWILQTILFGSFCSDALLWSGAEGWHFICRPFAEGRKKS